MEVRHSVLSFKLGGGQITAFFSGAGPPGGAVGSSHMEHVDVSQSEFVKWAK